MQKGYRFRIYPNKSIIQILLQWIGCQDFIYNSKVAEDLYFRSFDRKFLVDSFISRGFDQSYSHFKDKELTPWLFDVPSVLLLNGIKPTLDFLKDYQVDLHFIVNMVKDQFGLHQNYLSLKKSLTVSQV